MRPDLITRGLALLISGVSAPSPKVANLPHMADMQEPQLVQRLMLVTTAGITLLLVWAAFARLDDIARAGGILVAHGNNAVVQHATGGTLQEIYVHEGQRVMADQALLRLNDTDIEADTATIRQRMDFLESQVRRLGYALGLPQTVPSSTIYAEETTPPSPTAAVTPLLLPPPEDTSQSAATAPSIFAEIEPAAGITTPENDPQAVALAERRRTLRSGVTLANDEYRRQQNLRKQGYSTQSRVYAAERDLQAQNQSLAAFEADLAAQYASAMSEYYQQDEQLKKLASRAGNSVLRASTDGLVQNLRLNTPGATVPAGATLMELVPTDAPLEALLRLSPNHIGNVRVGQRAVIRISAFESSHYGTLQGTVSRISADAVTDSSGQPGYQVWVSIPQTLHGARGAQPLKPGMVLVAAIVTGRHTILDYLIRPIRNALDDLAPATRT